MSFLVISSAFVGAVIMVSTYISKYILVRSMYGISLVQSELLVGLVRLVRPIVAMTHNSQHDQQCAAWEPAVPCRKRIYDSPTVMLS